ncbi:MAG: carboxypeptidase-like regulatory domain-containing protein [Ignavibacteria bacterium]|nr:carboxypeptidase-like regulatory domain-containing protein [Ignavibacteria bacterium]
MKKFLHQLIFFVFVIVGSLIQNSCDAPHSNPFDPANPDKKVYTIEGYVYTFSLPRATLKNALVFWSPENIGSVTNSNGYFKIETFSKKEGWLTVKLDGYKPDSIYITWNSTKFYRDFFLNQIPKLDSIEFYSILLNHYPNIKNVNLIVRAKITDKDNDIDSVFIRNNSLKVNLPLEYNLQSKFYEKEFSEFDFGIDDFSELIGIKFDVIVKDLSGHEYQVGSEKLNRIIKEEIILEWPVNYDSTSSKPMLIWRRFVPGFKFTYNVEIYNDEFPPSVVWSKKNLSMESTSINVDTDLPSGNYFWVLWCVDQFLNRARSRPASFRVK